MILIEELFAKSKAIDRNDRKLAQLVHQHLNQPGANCDKILGIALRYGRGYVAEKIIAFMEDKEMYFSIPPEHLGLTEGIWYKALTSKSFWCGQLIQTLMYAPEDLAARANAFAVLRFRRPRYNHDFFFYEWLYKAKNMAPEMLDLWLGAFADGHFVHSSLGEMITASDDSLFERFATLDAVLDDDWYRHNYFTRPKYEARLAILVNNKRRRDVWRLAALLALNGELLQPRQLSGSTQFKMESTDEGPLVRYVFMLHADIVRAQRYFAIAAALPPELRIYLAKWTYPIVGEWNHSWLIAKRHLQWAVRE